MTGAEIADIVTTVCGTILILARMQSYVTVKEYREGKAALHLELNELRVKYAVLEERAKK